MPAGTLHALDYWSMKCSKLLIGRIAFMIGADLKPKNAGCILKKIHTGYARHFTAPVISAPALGDGTQHKLVECEYFTLEILSAKKKTIHFDTRGESFHAITVIEGKARLQSDSESIELEKFQTALVPASLGRYKFQPLENCRALKSNP